MNRDMTGMDSVEDVELGLLLEGVQRCYGFDFREYDPDWVKGRVRERLQEEGAGTISALQERVLRDVGCAQRLIAALSIRMTAMFRDPSFYAAFRFKVAPVLRTHPSLRIWIAGCSTGEEAYSLAILLEEEGLYERSRIYATDFDPHALAAAREGSFSLRWAEEYARNHVNACGKERFDNYYRVRAGCAYMDPSLRRNTVFAQHDLGSDGSFNEFHAVFCRNVLIYFNRGLQKRVHGLLHDSLSRFGYLGLGNKELLALTAEGGVYEAVDEKDKIYRKVGPPRRPVGKYLYGF